MERERDIQTDRKRVINNILHHNFSKRVNERKREREREREA
jgi:hypothetical protein